MKGLTAPSASLYEFANLFFRYDSTFELRAVSGRVGPGEIVGVVGPNGSGKTTLLRLLAGQLRAWDGTIRFLGRDLRSWRARELARHVAYLPQKAGLAFPFTVYEVVMMGRLPHQSGIFRESAADHRHVVQALELTGCLALADRPFHTLSGGEQQLVALASALAQEPKVLLLDEPTTFLDLRHRLQLAGILRRLHRDQGVSLVLVSHDLEFAESFCDRLWLLKSGRFVAEVIRRGERLCLPAPLLEEVFDVKAEESPGGPDPQYPRIVVRYGE
ncbi:MAG: ABC transporter ATP-binding protein [Acidobacteriota bacterium]